MPPACCNASTWLVAAPKPAAAAAAPPSPGAPSRVAPGASTLREFKLDGGRVRFTDAALPAGPLELNSLRALAQGLVWPLAPGAAPLATQLSAT